jgi:integrase
MLAEIFSGANIMNQKMVGKRINIPKYQGIYYRESSKRRHLGKSDRCFDICYRDGKGKLIWEKIGWTSEGYDAAFAAKMRAERMQTVRHGDELPREKKAEITLGEVWKYYDEWLDTGKKDAVTDRSYYKKHIEPVFAGHVLSKITPFDLEKFKKDLSTKNLAPATVKKLVPGTVKKMAPATVKHVLVLIRQLINKAIVWGKWHGENPIKKVKLPKLNNSRERFLSGEEAQLLLKELENVSYQLYNIALISLHTGMRAGEIFALKWGHIDIDNGMIHIADPKSGHARKAFMTNTIKEMFKTLDDEQSKQIDDSKSEEVDDGKSEKFVFESRVNTKIDHVSHAFWHAVDRLGFNKGIKDARQKVTFHTLRHTFASWLAMQGTPILTIKELLGHQSLAMTERYSHLGPDQKKEAIDDMEKLFKTAMISKQIKNQ